ncbi:MAG: hypothetical protein ACSLFH_14175 [Desulfuromonadales bacterium]
MTARALNKCRYLAGSNLQIENGEMTDITATPVDAVAVVSVTLKVFIPSLAPPGFGQSPALKNDRSQV